jgi:hypothetical protein
MPSPCTSCTSCERTAAVVVLPPQSIGRARFATGSRVGPLRAERSLSRLGNDHDSRLAARGIPRVDRRGGGKPDVAITSSEVIELKTCDAVVCSPDDDSHHPATWRRSDSVGNWPRMFCFHWNEVNAVATAFTPSDDPKIFNRNQQFNGWCTTRRPLQSRPNHSDFRWRNQTRCNRSCHCSLSVAGLTSSVLNVVSPSDKAARHSCLVGRARHVSAPSLPGVPWCPVRAKSVDSADGPAGRARPRSRAACH